MAAAAIRACQLYTVGYENRTPEKLVADLKKNLVKTLIDVRDVPLSRKPGFSKNRLAAALAEEGIDYLHLKTMGVPPEIRKSNLSLRAYMDAFRALLEGERAAEVEALLERVRDTTCCLLCLEQHFGDCHRHVVAEALSKLAGAENLRTCHLK